MSSRSGFYIRFISEEQIGAIEMHVFEPSPFALEVRSDHNCFVRHSFDMSCERLDSDITGCSRSANQDLGLMSLMGNC